MKRLILIGLLAVVGLLMSVKGMATEPVKGFYVSSVDTVVLSEKYRANLIAKLDGADMYLYGVPTCLDNSQKKAGMAKLIKAYHASYASGHVVCIIASASPSVGPLVHSIATYNRTHTSDERFDRYNVEWEFWNSNNSISDSAYAHRMKLVKDSLGSVEVYIGQVSLAQADTIVKYCSRVLIHYYFSSSKITGKYCLEHDNSRLVRIAAGAYRQSKTVEVVPIIANTDQFSGGYVARYGLTYFYNDYLRYYNAATIAHKSSLLLQGVQCYKLKWKI